MVQWYPPQPTATRPNENPLWQFPEYDPEDEWLVRQLRELVTKWDPYWAPPWVDRRRPVRAWEFYHPHPVEVLRLQNKPQDAQGTQTRARILAELNRVKQNREVEEAQLRERLALRQREEYLDNLLAAGLKELTDDIEFDTQLYPVTVQVAEGEHGGACSSSGMEDFHP